MLLCKLFIFCLFLWLEIDLYKFQIIQNKVTSNSSFIRVPEKIMLLPNKKESYKFDIIPMQRGNYKGAITFRPGEWPIKWDYMIVFKKS